MAFPLAEIDRHAEALVAVVFDGVDRLPADADRLAETFRDIHLAGRGASLFGVIEHLLRERGERCRSEAKPVSHEKSLKVDMDAKL